MFPRLNVNIDHVATVRQARRAPEPSIATAAAICEQAGADGITVHLRGDRRHIQDEDIYVLRRTVTTYLNVEMAATDEMVGIALKSRPDAVTFVAERPDEITTEGGLNVVENFENVRSAVEKLSADGLFVSLFIDPDPEQIEASSKTGAQQVELCTAAYAESTLGGRAIHSAGRVRSNEELRRLREASTLAAQRRLHVAAGHGLTIRNVGAVASIPEIIEFNIGHNIISQAIFVGLAEAVREIRARIRQGAE